MAQESTILHRDLRQSRMGTGFQVALVVKNTPASAGEAGSIPGGGRSPEGGSGSPRQYSCLENPMDGGAWWATVHRVAKSRTRLSNFTSLQKSGGRDFPGDSAVRNPLAEAGDARDLVSIAGS